MEAKTGSKLMRWLQSYFILVMIAVVALETGIAGLAGMWARRPPAGPCEPPMLLVGSREFTIKTIAPQPDGTFIIPKNKGDAAFWVEGTTANYVFGSSPTKNNLALDRALKPGDPMTINWADCSKDEYALKSLESTTGGNTAIFDQSSGGITLFIGTNSSGTGLVIRGERPVMQSAEPAAATPTGAQINISLLDPIPSSDPQTVIIGFSISNVGKQAITLTDHDISLKVEGGPEVFPSLVQPVLPREIIAGGSLTVTAAFPKPQAGSAVMRILDMTFDYYF